MIDIQNLVMKFEDLLVLDHVTGSVNSGTVVALLGPSGSGKSTLLRCVNLLEKPQSGHIFVQGQDILDAKCNIRKVRENVGMVFQHFNLFPNMTILENLVYAPCKVLGRKREEAIETAYTLLDQVGLRDKAETYASKLSGGQKQRVAIARSLAMNPSIMLFDEPTSALDPEMVKEVLDVIKGVVKKKMTVIIVTHEMQFAREIADEIWFLDQGSLIEKSPPDVFFATPKTERAKDFLDKVL